LVEQPEGGRPPERPGLMWEDSIKMDLTEISLEGVDWINVAEDMNWWPAFVKLVMNLQIS
jgi:hypothetical protein